MESLEVSAKTVEEAIRLALAKLGKQREEVLISVLSEGSRGILGIGSEDARILVTPVDVGEGEEELEEEAEVEEEEISPEEVLERGSEILEDLLRAMGVRATVTVRPPVPDADGQMTPGVLDIHGDDLGILIGRRGETLSSLQFVTNLILSRQPAPLRARGRRRRELPPATRRVPAGAGGANGRPRAGDKPARDVGGDAAARAPHRSHGAQRRPLCGHAEHGRRRRPPGRHNAKEVRESVAGLPSFLAIGHVAKDLVPEGWTLGGGVTFAALTAQALGYEAAVLSCASAEVGQGLAAALPGATLHVVPSASSTTFRNLYVAGRREQHLLAAAGPLQTTDLPSAWREAPLVLLTPLLDEVGEGFMDLFPRALLGVSAQGWFRGVAPDGRIYPVSWPASERVLARADVLVFSDEDVGGNRALVEAYASRARVLVLTEGERGATLYVAGKRQRICAWPARAVDPTGAGDAFAAAFLIAYFETGEPLAAARFASCVASFVVEAKGVSGVPSRLDVERCLRAPHAGQSSGLQV